MSREWWWQSTDSLMIPHYCYCSGWHKKGWWWQSTDPLMVNSFTPYRWRLQTMVLTLKPTIHGQLVKSWDGLCCNTSGIYIVVYNDDCACVIHNDTERWLTPLHSVSHSQINGWIQVTIVGDNVKRMVIEVQIQFINMSTLSMANSATWQSRSMVQTYYYLSGIITRWW
jgi:hypothetical protein